MTRLLDTFSGPRVQPFSFTEPDVPFELYVIMGGGMPRVMAADTEYTIADGKVTVLTPIPSFGVIEVVRALGDIVEVDDIVAYLYEEPKASVDVGDPLVTIGANKFRNLLRFSPRPIVGSSGSGLGQVFRVGGTPQTFSDVASSAIANVKTVSSDINAYGKVSIESWGDMWTGDETQIIWSELRAEMANTYKNIPWHNTVPRSIGLGASIQQQDSDVVSGRSRIFPISNGIVPFMKIKTDNAIDVIRNGVRVTTRDILPGDIVKETFLQGSTVASLFGVSLEMWILPTGIDWVLVEGKVTIYGVEVPSLVKWTVERLLLELVVPTLYDSQYVVFNVKNSVTGGKFTIENLTTLFDNRTFSIEKNAIGWYTWAMGKTSPEPQAVSVNLYDVGP